MPKICCSSGKAKVTYTLPSQGGLKYRLKGETKWKNISAEEALTSECLPNNTIQGVYATYTTDDGVYHEVRLKDVKEPPSTSGIFFKQIASMGAYWAQVWFVTITDGDGENTFRVVCGDMACSDYVRSMAQPTLKVIRPGAKPYIFRIKGESGQVYLEKEVTQCPDVQQAGCVFDPKNEQTLTVELGFFDAPILRNIPGFPNALPTILRDCVEVVTQDNAIQIRKVGEIGYYVGENLVWIPTGLFSVVKQVDSPSGCPAPKFKIECYDPKDRSKKCPPETDCQVECNGFLCCYSKGKLIQSIKL